MIIGFFLALIVLPFRIVLLLSSLIIGFIFAVPVAFVKVIRDPDLDFKDEYFHAAEKIQLKIYPGLGH